MEIVNFKNIDRNDWDTLVKYSDKTWLYDTYEYIAIIYRSLLFENLSFGIYHNEKIICSYPLF